MTDAITPAFPAVRARSIGGSACRLLLAAALSTSAWSATAQTVVDAAGARQALARGAVAWDLRDASTAVLPGAVRVDRAAVDVWLQRGDVQALAVAVSAAGLDLSREVLVYGDVQDGRVAQIAGRLADVSRGQVHWLAAGFEAWQQAGLPTAVQASRRLPVPQRLTAVAALGTAAVSMSPADAARRSSSTFSLAPASERLARAGS